MPADGAQTTPAGIRRSACPVGSHGGGHDPLEGQEPLATIVHDMCRDVQAHTSWWPIAGPSCAGDAKGAPAPVGTKGARGQVQGGSSLGVWSPERPLSPGSFNTIVWSPPQP